MRRWLRRLAGRPIPIMLTTALLATATQAAEPGGTLKRIADRGEMIIGYVPDAPPMSYEDAEGNAVGYSITLCKWVAAAVKTRIGRDDMKISYVPLILPEDRLQAVETGAVDIECGASTLTLSRRERVDFSLITYVTGGGILSLNKAPIDSIAGVEKKTIAVIEGTTTHQRLRELGEVNEIAFTLRIVQTHLDGFHLLDTGKIDGYATDRAMMLGLVYQSADPSRYAITKQVFTREPYALMLQRGDTEFRLVVDRALAKLFRTARIRRIYQDWFGRYGETMPAIVEAVYEIQAVGE